MEIDEARKRFLKCVPNHATETLLDNGLYRHLRFKQPDRSQYWFDIVTWPGYLCITGDNGSYVFSRVEDMFRFFRLPARCGDNSEIAINPDYWAQKLEAQDCNGRHVYSVRRWSQEAFEANVRQEVARYMREHMSATHMPEEDILSMQGARKDLIEAVRDEVMGHDNDIEAMRAAYAFSFEYQVKRKGSYDYLGREMQTQKFYFHDWEYDSTEWDYAFLWNCFAIVWGIQKYDESRAQTGVAA